jgi:hypothetical protein
MSEELQWWRGSVEQRLGAQRRRVGCGNELQPSIGWDNEMRGQEVGSQW